MDDVSKASLNLFAANATTTTKANENETFAQTNNLQLVACKLLVGRDDCKFRRELAVCIGVALVTFVAVRLIILIIRRFTVLKTFERMQVPGPRPHLISGHLYESRRRPFVHFAKKLHEAYGKNVGIFLGADPFLLTTDFELIKQAFVSKSRTFYNRMFFYLNVDPVPDNLICMRGARWRYMRKLLTPAFSNSRLIKSSSFYADTHQTVIKFINQLQASKQQQQQQCVTQVSDTYDRMAAIALDVIVKTVFHMDKVIKFNGPLYCPDNCKSSTTQKLAKSSSSSFSITLDCDKFLETVKRASRIAFNPLIELIFCFPFLDAPLTALANKLYFGSIIQLLFERLDYLVRANNNTNSNDDKNIKQLIINTNEVELFQGQSTNKHKRIVDSLIEVLRNGKITRNEFTGNALVIVFAGFETTANALTFTLWLLAKHQKIQHKLREHLKVALNHVNRGDDVIDNGENKTVAAAENLNDAQLVKLATGCLYLEAIINESLRLYPPVPGLSCRQASVDCQLSTEDGTTLNVEQYVNILPSVFTIHRSPEIWGADANDFKPERFELLDSRQLNSPMFMPFGLGPRNCIGNKLAMHELKIVVGCLLLKYQVRFVCDETPEELELSTPINITLTCAHKIPLEFVELH